MLDLADKKDMPEVRWTSRAFVLFSYCAKPKKDPEYRVLASASPQDVFFPRLKSMNSMGLSTLLGQADGLLPRVEIAGTDSAAEFKLYNRHKARRSGYLSGPAGWEALRIAASEHGDFLLCSFDLSRMSHRWSRARRRNVPGGKNTDAPSKRWKTQLAA